MSEFPKYADCVVVGTNLINSIVAAACSRIGKSVVHFDSNNYYGEDWASMTFDQFVKTLKEIDPDYEKIEQDVPQSLLEKSRYFCIDLCPKLLFTNGRMVDLLVSSNVARYHEFSNSVQIYSLNVDNQSDISSLVALPYKRVDVFTSPLLKNLIDKRRLTKFIETCVLFDEDNQPSGIGSHLNEPIQELLTSLNLKNPIIHMLINSVAMTSPNEHTEIACRNIKKFMLATQKYGKSPFLFPIYGSGEFSQSFCRLSAVFGGTYCLNKTINRYQKGEDSSITVYYDQSESIIKCQKLVANYKFLDLKQSKISAYVHRAIVITKCSIFEQDHPGSFIRLNDRDNKNQAIHLLQVSSTLLVAPKDHFIVYLWTESSRQCLEKIIKKYIKEDIVLWISFYKQPIVEGKFIDSEKIIAASSSNGDLDYDKAVLEAERIFKAMYPNEEFLPRAPDPDEIIL